MDETRIMLLPGIPDDDNRDYLPESLKESRIVVNENGNNSQVYPSRLQECRGRLVDDFEDVWYEYVPESFCADNKTPLVFSMHGGLMTGWGQLSANIKKFREQAGFWGYSALKGKADR